MVKFKIWPGDRFIKTVYLNPFQMSSIEDTGCSPPSSKITMAGGQFFHVCGDVEFVTKEIEMAGD